MASQAFSLTSLASLALAQMKMKEPGVYVYASQSLMKDNASVPARELWGLWEPFAAQVQNQIRAFASGPWPWVQVQVLAFASEL